MGGNSGLQGEPAVAETNSVFAKQLFHMPDLSASCVGSTNGRVIYIVF